MPATPNRPLSPHLSIWRWGPHMAVSILHRATGAALTIGGLALLAWWLLAIAQGGEQFSAFSSFTGHWAGLVVLIGLSWAFFQHTLSGIRHLVMDTGHGFEIEGNKRGAVLTIILSLVLTAALWAYFLGRGA